MSELNFNDIKDDNIFDVEVHFSEKLKNLEELKLILSKYSLPFFKNDNNDLIYYHNGEKTNSKEIIVFDNNTSLMFLFDGIITLLFSANPISVKFLQRSVFEFLVVNNHLILTDDEIYIKKWIERKDIKIVKTLLKRTDNPYSKELIDFWVNLSKQSHASLATTNPGLDISETYGEYIDNIFITYILLSLYNYQLRELYFPFMKSVFKKMNINIRQPYVSDRFKIKDKIKEFEKPNINKKLFDLIKGFEYNWKLKQ